MSLSFSAGMIGAVMTPTGIPASDSALTAASRVDGSKPVSSWISRQSVSFTLELRKSPRRPSPQPSWPTIPVRLVKPTIPARGIQ